LADRTRIGVIGCGLIAQVMHLPYLAELSDRYEISAMCDLSPEVVNACGERYRVSSRYVDWREMLGQPLDAVLIATSGDHAPIAISAAEAGLHVLVEKPMALSAADAELMVQAADETGVTLMVGTMKRYDPAYERLGELLDGGDDLHLVRVTTLESPWRPYVAHYPLVTGAVDPAVLAELQATEEQTVIAALPEADDETRECYRWILLDNLTHELNALRGVLGDPTEIVFASLSARCVAVNLRFGELDCHLSWVDLPGIARYRQEFAFYAPGRRLTLELPSPFLRSAPSRLITEGGEAGTADGWQRDEVVAYDEAFRRELVEFSECLRTGRPARTAGSDAVQDMRLCEQIARTHAERVAPALAGGNGAHSVAGQGLA